MHSHQPETSFWLHVSWRSSQACSRPFAGATFLSLFFLLVNFPLICFHTALCHQQAFSPVHFCGIPSLWLTAQHHMITECLCFLIQIHPHFLLVSSPKMPKPHSETLLTKRWHRDGQVLYTVWCTKPGSGETAICLCLFGWAEKKRWTKRKKSITTNNIINREQFQGPFASDYQRGHEVDYMQQWYINTGSPAAWACRSMTKGWFSSKKESLKVNLKSREGACFPNLETNSTEDGPDCWRLFLWSMLWE